jgi:hypothetical protein
LGPQRRKPAAQLTPQAVPSQVAKPLTGAGQAVHEGPHEAGLLLETQLPPQRWKPVLQAAMHAVPLQVATPLAGARQALQLAPQELTLVFETQIPLQAWKPVLQVKLQLVPLQVATPLAGTGQATHELPHDVTLVFETQTPPQRCRLCPQPFSAAVSSPVCEPSSDGNTHPARPAALTNKIIKIPLPNRFIVGASCGANDGGSKSSQRPSEFPGATEIGKICRAPQKTLTRWGAAARF